MNSKSKWCQNIQSFKQGPIDWTPMQIFIGGLPLIANQTDLATLFDDDFTSLLEVRIMRFRDGRSRGFGFIRFGDQVEYQRALDIKTFNVRGTLVECRPSVSGEVAAEEAKKLLKRKLIVYGIPATLQASQIHSYFAVFGEIIRAKIFRNNKKSHQADQGYVEFESPTSVRRLLQNLEAPKIEVINSIPILIYSAEAKSSSTKNWKELFSRNLRNSSMRIPIFSSEKSVEISQKTTTESQMSPHRVQLFSNFHNQAAHNQPSKFKASPLPVPQGNYRINLSLPEGFQLQRVLAEGVSHTLAMKPVRPRTNTSSSNPASPENILKVLDDRHRYSTQPGCLPLEYATKLVRNVKARRRGPKHLHRWVSVASGIQGIAGANLM